MDLKASSDVRPFYLYYKDMLNRIFQGSLERIFVRFMGYVYSLCGIAMLLRRFIDDIFRYSLGFQRVLLALTVLYVFGGFIRDRYVHSKDGKDRSNTKILSKDLREKILGFSLVTNREDTIIMIALNLVILLAVGLFGSMVMGERFPEVSLSKMLSLGIIGILTGYSLFSGTQGLLLRLSIKALDNFRISNERLEGIFGSGILDNGSINTVPFLLAILLSSVYQTVSLLSVDLLGLDRACVDLMNMILVAVLGSLVSLYLVKVSMIAKSSDILLDTCGDGESKDYSDWDKACDVLADGMFSKLIVLFLTVRGLLSGSFDLTLFVRNNLLVLVYSLFKRYSSARKDSLSDISDSCRMLVVISMLLDPQVRPANLVVILGVLRVLSVDHFRYLAGYIGFDGGALGLIPSASSYLVSGLSFFTLGGNLNMNQFFGFGALPALLHLDQAGYIADLHGEHDSKLDLLDVVGNSNKGTFKFYVTRLFGAGTIMEMESHSINIVSANIFLLLCASVFYPLLRELSITGIGKGLDRINGSLVRFLSLNLLIPSYTDPSMINAFVLSGACADNLKKVQQLDLVKTSKDTLELSKYLDIMGDFSKDVVYPLYVARLIMESLSIFSWIQLELRQWMYSLRSQLFESVMEGRVET